MIFRSSSIPSRSIFEELTMCKEPSAAGCLPAPPRSRSPLEAAFASLLAPSWAAAIAALPPDLQLLGRVGRLAAVIVLQGSRLAQARHVMTEKFGPVRIGDKNTLVAKVGFLKAERKYAVQAEA